MWIPLHSIILKGEIIMSNWTYVDGKITLKVKSRGIGDDSPIYRIIADAPKITGEEGSTVFTIRPLDQFPIREGEDYYHEAEITLDGRLRDRTLDETCEEIEDFINYLMNGCLLNTSVYGEITVKEDHKDKIADDFYVGTSKTYEILS